MFHLCILLCSFPWDSIIYKVHTNFHQTFSITIDYLLTGINFQYRQLEKARGAVVEETDFLLQKLHQQYTYTIRVLLHLHLHYQGATTLSGYYHTYTHNPFLYIFLHLLLHPTQYISRYSLHSQPHLLLTH